MCLLLFNTIEQMVIDILHHANFAAIHAGRIKLMSIDISFVNFMMNKTTINPYENSTNQSGPLELEHLSEDEDGDGDGDVEEVNEE